MQGLLLINLGTPDAPTTRAVGRYLREFLMDPRVLDMPWWRRALLVHGLIVPRRAPRSAAAYRTIWTRDGSPLLVHGQQLAGALQRQLGDTVAVKLAMRYQQPSIREALTQFRSEGLSRITLFPLFPQYSAAAWSSAVDRVHTLAQRTWDLPAIQVVPPYCQHPAFLDAHATIVRESQAATGLPDHTLFTFHGLPERQVRRSALSGAAYDYHTQCVATAHGIAARLGLTAAQYEIAFQSRLGRDPWIQPWTDERLIALARAGCRRLLVISPSFVADCLETLEEIGLRGAAEFRAAGGEMLHLVPALNSHPAWIRAVQTILDDFLRAYRVDFFRAPA